MLEATIIFGSYFVVSKEFHTYVLAKEEFQYHRIVIPRDLCETE